MESSEDAIISRTLDGTIISWNRGAERLYGYAAEEVIGRSNAFLYPPEHPHEMPEILEKIRRGESIDHYETVRVTKDGRRVHVSLTVSPTIDAAGNVTGDSGIAHDITERKRIEEDLRKAQEHFRTVFEEAAVGLCTADPRSWTLLETNEAYRKMFGYTEEELRGKNISDISHPEDARHDPEFAAKILSGEVKRYEREKRYVRKDGRPAASRRGDSMGVRPTRIASRRRMKMAAKKTPIKPTRRPRPEDVRGAAGRAREFADRLREKYPGRRFADSSEIVREDRDTRS